MGSPGSWTSHTSAWTWRCSRSTTSSRNTPARNWNTTTRSWNTTTYHCITPANSSPTSNPWNSTPSSRSSPLVGTSSSKSTARNADRPVVKDFAVLLKSEAYDTVKDIPDGRECYKSVSGLVINRIESLGDDEKRLIRGKFPEIDFDKILIVERGRKPSSVALSIGIIAGGALLVLLPVAFFVRRLVGRRPAAGFAGPAEAAPDGQGEDAAHPAADPDAKIP